MVSVDRMIIPVWLLFKYIDIIEHTPSVVVVEAVADDETVVDLHTHIVGMDRTLERLGLE